MTTNLEHITNATPKDLANILFTIWQSGYQTGFEDADSIPDPTSFKPVTSQYPTTYTQWEQWLYEDHLSTPSYKPPS